MDSISIQFRVQGKDYLKMAIPISEPTISTSSFPAQQYPEQYNNLHRRRRRHRAGGNHTPNFTTVDSNNNSTNYPIPNMNNITSEASPIPTPSSIPPSSNNYPDNTEMSFLQQLIQELYNVWSPYLFGSSGGGGRRRNISSSTHLPSIDNQSPTGHQNHLFSSLPDVIQCSLDLTVDAGVNTSPIGSDDEELSSSEEEIYAPSIHQQQQQDEDWSLELKVSVVSPWRQTGRDLRRIADQFSLENAHRRRRSPPNSSRRYFKLHFGLKVAVVPALALLGLGLNYLRR